MTTRLYEGVMVYDTYYLSPIFLDVVIRFLKDYNISYIYDSDEGSLTINTNIEDNDIYNMLEFLVLGSLEEFEN